MVGKATVDQIVLQAAEHFSAGRPEEADALCAEVLKGEPDHLPALHLAAVAAFVTDRAADGAALLGRILTVDPGHAPALVTLGDALAVKGRAGGRGGRIPARAGQATGRCESAQQARRGAR